RGPVSPSGIRRRRSPSGAATVRNTSSGLESGTLPTRWTPRGTTPRPLPHLWSWARLEVFNLVAILRSLVSGARPELQHSERNRSTWRPRGGIATRTLECLQRGHILRDTTEEPTDAREAGVT